MRIYPKVGIQVPDILLPVESIPLEKWSVVACDQYTSQPDYWDQVESITNATPSTYQLILPEAYLGKPKEKTHQTLINATMSEFLNKGIFQSVTGMIYIERNLGSKIRNGLVAALDLEQYEFSQNSTSLIRATEGTIVDRLPPRIKIRKNAPLETPHIMVLIDDPEFSVIEPLSKIKNDLPKVYDFNLMMDGGNLKGFLINNLEIETQVINSLSSLTENNQKKFASQTKNAPILFAVGDGNHSLATAKSIWELLKGKVNSDHPARYALVEIVNIHNNGIVFEPIHRLIENCKSDILLEFSNFFTGKVHLEKSSNFNAMVKSVSTPNYLSQKLGIFWENRCWNVEILHPQHTLTVGSLQLFLDDLIMRHPEINIDYIHGEETLQSLGSQTECAGFFLPGMEKSSLFESVIKDGPLPRKTFSMGEAHEKRYYLECRKIQGE